MLWLYSPWGLLIKGGGYMYSLVHAQIYGEKPRLAPDGWAAGAEALQDLDALRGDVRELGEARLHLLHTRVERDNQPSH